MDKGSYSRKDGWKESYDIFGSEHVGQNYGWVFLAYGVDGIFGPVLGGKLGDMGNFPPAFTIVGVLYLIAAGIIATIKPPIKSVKMILVHI